MNDIKKAIAHFEYGVKCDIFQEPVTSYAKAAISALEKQIPKKLRVDDESWLCCPKCDETFKLHNQYHERNRYCGNCGQKIDWSEVNAKKKE